MVWSAQAFCVEIWLSEVGRFLPVVLDGRLASLNLVGVFLMLITLSLCTVIEVEIHSENYLPTCCLIWLRQSTADMGAFTITARDLSCERHSLLQRKETKNKSFPAFHLGGKPLKMTHRRN